jgi:hypothetical protein
VLSFQVTEVRFFFALLVLPPLSNLLQEAIKVNITPTKAIFRSCFKVFFIGPIFTENTKKLQHQTLTPNKDPTPADSAIAIVPQIVMRITAFQIGEPPVRAAVAPSKIKARMVKPYNQNSMPFTGANKITNKGNIPPTENAAPEARAA